MGAWGAGLYSSDFALDLRSTIAAISRLPFDGEEILNIVRETEQQAADDPRDEDHTTFWLVAADQFQKRGIVCEEVTSKAISLINSGADAIMLEELGMPASGLRRRSAKLSELRKRLRNGGILTRRTTLKKPQRLVVAVGDVLVFPTSRGAPINPYFQEDQKQLYGWVQDAWGAVLIVDAGHAFGYLAWYTVMVVKNEFTDRPSMSMLMGSPWVARGSGTCSRVHFQRMRLDRVGRVALNRDTLESNFGKLEPGIQAAVLDVSISNHTYVLSKNQGPPHTHSQPRMERAKSLNLADFATEAT